MLEWLKEDRKIYAWVPVLLWAGVIMLFSLLPYAAHPPLTIGYFDMMVHFFEYTVLGALVTRAFYRNGVLPVLKNFLFALILGCGYGIVMELLQRIIPGRQPSVEDVAANVAGMVFGILLGKVILWQK